MHVMLKMLWHRGQKPKPRVASSYPPPWARWGGSVYSAAGSQTGVIGSPAMTLRTKGTESFNEAFTVAP